MTEIPAEEMPGLPHMLRKLRGSEQRFAKPEGVGSNPAWSTMRTWRSGSAHLSDTQEEGGSTPPVRTVTMVQDQGAGV